MNRVVLHHVLAPDKFCFITALDLHAAPPRPHDFAVLEDDVRATNNHNAMAASVLHCQPIHHETRAARINIEAILSRDLEPDVVNLKV